MIFLRLIIEDVGIDLYVARSKELKNVYVYETINPAGGQDKGAIIV